MEPLKLKNNLAKGINRSFEKNTFKTGIQDDLNHQIANICYKTLRYIDENYGKDIYSDTEIQDKDIISNIQKLLIYIFIIFYFHSANNNLRDTYRNETDWKPIFKNTIQNLYELWFFKNKFAEVPSTMPTINRPTEYKPFKNNHDVNKAQYEINKKKIFIFINDNFLDSKLVNIIANSVYNIAKNNYNILTALLSDPYDISDNFEVGLNHPNVPNMIIKANDFISGNYGNENPLTIQPANLIQIEGADINLAIGGTHYLINNIVFDNTTNLPVTTTDKKYIKVLDFMPVKNITAANVTRITNMADVALIANITMHTQPLTLKPLDANDPEAKYFSHKLVNNNNNSKYEHEFNNQFALNGNNSLKFELYVIKEP